MKHTTLKTLGVTAIALACSMQATAAPRHFGQHDVLYIAHAKQGVISKNHTNRITLALNNTNLSYFYDRPSRIAGEILAKKFVDDWSMGRNNFKADPPNAAMAASKVELLKNKRVDEFVTLSSPSYNAANDTLTFTVKPLEGQPSLAAGKYNDVVLFIDGGEFPSAAQCSFGNIGPNCN